MSKLLALDLSSNVGWALLERRGAPPTFGTERLPPAMGDDQGARFEHLYEFLHSMHMDHRYDALAYEKPITGSKFAKKDDMVAAAMKAFNWKVSDDHQADAGAVGVWAYEQLWPKARAAA